MNEAIRKTMRIWPTLTLVYIASCFFFYALGTGDANEYRAVRALGAAAAPTLIAGIVAAYG